jgi:hypothetical protein
MDGIGDISAYHGHLFLGGIKAQALVTQERDALRSKMVTEYGFNALAPFAKAIAHVLDGDESEAEVLEALVYKWATTIARLCIGLRQRETGGAFHLTPEPMKDVLEVDRQFEYPRLRDATILHVLDKRYSWVAERATDVLIRKSEPVPADLLREAMWAVSRGQGVSDTRICQRPLIG